jgi:hypothetical protein
MSNKLFSLNESVINTVRSVIVNSQEQEIKSLIEQASSLFFTHNKDQGVTLPVFVKEYVMKKTMNSTLATICETVARDMEGTLTETVETNDKPQMLSEAAGSKPRNEKEKRLAAMAPPKNKITHKDVLVGRGVVAKEAIEQKEIKPSDFHAVRTGKMTMDDLAKKMNTTTSKLRGEYNLHSDHWSKGQAHYNKMFGIKEATDTPGNSYKHQCAVHVKHEQFGEGKTIHSQHAEPDDQGTIAWYDVMFDHGIEKHVSINEMQVLQSESHMNHPKKKKMKEEVQNKSGESHQAATTMKHAVNPTKAQRDAAKDIQPGVKGYRDRIAMLKDLKATGKLKKEEVELGEMKTDPETLRADRASETRTTPGGRKIVVKKPKTELKVEEVELDEAKMKWRTDTAHSEPSKDQDSAEGHNRAADFWAHEMKTGLSARRRLQAKAMHKYHQGQAASMRSQGVKEEVELDEISKPALNKYLRAATQDRDITRRSAERAQHQEKDLEFDDPKRSKKWGEESKFLKGIQARREKGMALAYKKLKKEEVELDEAKRGRPRKNPLPVGQAPEDEDRENFVMQMRKSVSMRGKKDVEFDNGEKAKVPAHVASAFLNHYNSLRTADEKDSLHHSVSKSPKHLMSYFEKYHGN